MSGSRPKQFKPVLFKDQPYISGSMTGNDTTMLTNTRHVSACPHDLCRLRTDSWKQWQTHLSPTPATPSITIMKIHL